jgi:hypothetical protein
MYVGFEVFTAVVMKNINFWDVTPFSLLSCNRLTCWFLLKLFLRPWRWRRYVPPKRLLTINRLHGVISQKTVLFFLWFRFLPFLTAIVFENVFILFLFNYLKNCRTYVLDIKFVLYFLYRMCSKRVSLRWIFREIHAKSHAGIHVMSSVTCLIEIKFGAARQFFINFSNIKCHGNSLSGSSVEIFRQMERERERERYNHLYTRSFQAGCA